MEPHTDDPGRFSKLAFVHIGDPSAKPTAVRSARPHQDVVLMTFEGVDDRNAAEALRDQWLYVPIADAVPLEEGEYYLFQLVGLAVYDENENNLGQLTEVIETGANNVFVVRGQYGEILLPDIPEVIHAIDFDKGMITVHLLPGLVDPAILTGEQAPPNDKGAG